MLDSPCWMPNDMNLNEFYQWASEDIERMPRIIVCATRRDAQEIRNWILTRKEKHIANTSDCVTECEWYPMPEDVFERLREAVDKDAETVVFGLDAYAGLLKDEVLCSSLHAGLLNWIDTRHAPPALFVVCGAVLPGLREVFRNPRYVSGKKIIYVGGNSDSMESSTSPAIYLVAERWFKKNAMPPDVKSFQAYLQAYEDGTLDEVRTCIAVPAKNGSPLAGLRGDIRQVMTLRDFMAVFQGVDDPLLSEEALERIHQEGVPNDVSLKDFIDASSVVQREIVLWKLKQQAQPNSYLWNVFEKGATAADFIRCFVCAAAQLLSRTDAEKLAGERKKLMEEAGLRSFESHIPSFIEMTQREPAWQRIVWLNNGSDIEKTELLRILGKDFSENIRAAVFKVYPEVRAYLSEDEDAYFTEYRNLKIQNKCTESFFIKAFENSCEPEGVHARDFLIQPFRENGETALLMVDAMGVEWLPMLTTAARERGIRVASALAGHVQLPTITAVNKINWASERTLQGIKKLDNIVHDGEEKHVAKPAEENLRAQLDVVSNEVLRAVGEGLAKYPRVLLTADHGASRLAVCAWDQDLVKTLEISNVEILDWRYCKNAPESEEFEKPLNGDYSVVRGYNRLPKKGGKIFELHGGATLEERLVPVVVFERGPAQTKPKTTKAPPFMEIQENDAFANL